jgi:cytidine deaminase
MKSPESLLVAARDAAGRAYAPYSRFRVGAAVVAEGRIFTGCNVENASHGLSLCAERVAVFSAIAAGCRHLEALALSCIDAPRSGNPGGNMPCGACRQVLAEFAGAELPIHIDGAGSFTLGALLPHAFTLATPES